VPEQLSWEKLAARVIDELRKTDDRNQQKSYYSYYFDTPESIKVLAAAMEKANAAFMWEPIQEVTTYGRRRD